MPSFRLAIKPHRKAAARFVDQVHRALQRAFDERPDLTQAAVAEELDVNRSVVNRQIRGHADMSLGRVGELAYIFGYDIEFKLVKPEVTPGTNFFKIDVPVKFESITKSSGSETTEIRKNRESFSEFVSLEAQL